MIVRECEPVLLARLHPRAITVCRLPTHPRGTMAAISQWSPTLTFQSASSHATRANIRT